MEHSRESVSPLLPLAARLASLALIAPNIKLQDFLLVFGIFAKYDDMEQGGASAAPTFTICTIILYDAPPYLSPGPKPWLLELLGWLVENNIFGEYLTFGDLPCSVALAYWKGFHIWIDPPQLVVSTALGRICQLSNFSPDLKAQVERLLSPYDILAIIEKVMLAIIWTPGGFR
ncbi:hypothetical protein FRB93_001750 [Tulasnella sp. JGI-2019a]|nr:hypothetical protein FRB93_001750 [Tulasnella sp. JGI-2019a]